MKKKAYRFSPSPTGKLHLGSARTAMISYILAKKNSAEFHLRIEDTDAARSTTEFEHEILDSLSWLGLEAEPSMVRQSDQEAGGVYRQIADRLKEAGLAYHCNCSKLDLKRMKAMQMTQKKPLGYEGTCRARANPAGVLRLDIGAVRMFLAPNEYGGGKDLHFHDHVYGPRHIDIRDLRDIVLLRADGTATYLMANTIDDTLTGISNIVRGADILPQTAIQILLRQVITKVMHLDETMPEYTHVPLVLGEGGEKLSKRSPTTKSIADLRDDGLLPEAINQFILGIGNNSVPRDRAVGMQELIDGYDESNNAKNNVAFSFHQLKHINKLHIRNKTSAELNVLMGTGYPDKLLDVCKYRNSTLADLMMDLDKSTIVLDKFQDELDVLKSNGFSKQDCIEFRTDLLGGEDGMSLSILAGLK